MWFWSQKMKQKTKLDAIKIALPRNLIACLNINNYIGHFKCCCCHLNCVESTMNPYFLPVPFYFKLTFILSWSKFKILVSVFSYPPLHCEIKKWAMKLTFGADSERPTQHARCLCWNCVRNSRVYWTRRRISLLCMQGSPLKSRPKHKRIDSSYCWHWRLRGLQMWLYQMQNPY